MRVDFTAGADPEVVPLTPDFSAAQDPDLSYDGRELLFTALKTPASRWQIYRMSFADGVAEPIVDLPFDCLGPRHLPNGRIVFFGPVDNYEEDGPVPASALYIVDPDVAEPTRVTFNVSSDFKPLVLSDGRVLFSSWRHHGTYHGLRGRFALGTVQWDGTGLWTFDDSHTTEGVRVPAALAPDGGVYSIRYPSLESADGERIVSYDTGDPYAGERLVAGSDLGDFRSVLPLGSRTLLSLRPQGKKSYGVYQLGERGAPPVAVFDDPLWDETDIALIRRRPRPMTRFAQTDSSRATGLIFCQDIYRSSVHKIPRGRVRRVRIIEGQPVSRKSANQPRFFPAGIPLNLRGTTSDSATGFIQKRILGEIEPAADGSFAARVPADRPLHIQLLDSRGMALATQSTWFWVRPGENRGCIGCHEDRETSIRNQISLAVDQGPVDLSRVSKYRTVDFRRDVAPVLTRNCGVESCHSGPDPTADLNMDVSGELVWHDSVRRGDRTVTVEGAFFDGIYESLLRPQRGKPHVVGSALVHPGVARNSPLVWMIYGKKLGSTYKPAPFRRPIGPEHPDAEISLEDLRRIAEWVDLGAQWDNLPGPDPWSSRAIDTIGFHDRGTKAARKAVSTRND